MPVLTVPLTSDGALADVLVGLSRPEVRKRRAAGQAIPAEVAVRALLDTGAECTCVDPSVIATLGLPLKGITLANLPAGGGTMGATQHDGSLTVVHPSGDPDLNLNLAEWPLTELPLALLGYEAVIGRDVLDRCLLIHNGPNKDCTLSY